MINLSFYSYELELMNIVIESASEKQMNYINESTPSFQACPQSLPLEGNLLMSILN